MLCRWTVMTKRACAANTTFLGILRLNGFLKDLWNPKSEDNSTNQHSPEILASVNHLSHV